MKLTLLLIGIMFAEMSISQSTADTTIEKRQLDSIQYLVYKFKDSLRRVQYVNNALVNTHYIDTIAYSKDSIVITYKSKTNKLIKTHTKKDLQSDGLYGYEKIEYLNNIERPEFVEHWELARSSDDEIGQVFTWKVYSYERFVYDSTKRLITSIKFYPAFSRRRVRKYEHKYHIDGTQTSTNQSIEIEKFWD